MHTYRSCNVIFSLLLIFSCQSHECCFDFVLASFSYFLCFLSPVPWLLCFLSAQDAGLDALAAVISRQKTMGQEIGNELDEQNGRVNVPLLHFGAFLSLPCSQNTTYQNVKLDRQMLVLNGTTCLINPAGKKYSFPLFVTLLLETSMCFIGIL
ncbi:hypothetical protein ILYODFUR_018733 [Ilyodon furcidens]|uniref:Uncharacterized protein n=1 Tax=Ilyodon furcidens TaxID=33524 RepID=A0ABV0SMF9_9TELE